MDLIKRAFFCVLILWGVSARAEVVVNIKGVPDGPSDAPVCKLEFTAQNKDAVKRTIYITGFTAEDAQGKPLKVVNQVVNLGKIEPSAFKKSSLPNEVRSACLSMNIKIQEVTCIPFKECQIKWTSEGIAGARRADLRR